MIESIRSIAPRSTARKVVVVGGPSTRSAQLLKQIAQRASSRVASVPNTAKPAARARPDLLVCLHTTHYSVSYVAVFFLPMPPLLYRYTVISITIIPQPIVWTINIRPVREYLLRHDHHDSRGGVLLLCLPWAWL